MEFLKNLGISESNYGASTGKNWMTTSNSRELDVYSPVDGKKIASVFLTSDKDYDQIVEKANQAYLKWRAVPAPKRGEIIRQFGEKLRKHKNDLGSLVSYEMGKSLEEGRGEVQEMIDICDFAVGLSRQLYGYTISSERPHHRLYDQYHPVGITGIITAFNFPVAVWSWNAAIAIVCGNATIWKPSKKVPLSAIAVFNILAEVISENDIPEGLFSLVIGTGSTVGESLISDERIPLISFTGSVAIGRHVSQTVAKRFGRTILELGGNNGIIITAEADLNLAIKAVVFGAIGTAGQRCTTTRRLIVHEEVYQQMKESLVKAYKSLKIGDPLDKANHVGPLIDREAVEEFTEVQAKIKEQGGKIIYGGDVLEGEGYKSGCYVMPAIAEVDENCDIVKDETFAPLLYLIKYRGELSEALRIHNSVPQGLSSAVFTRELQEAEEFLSSTGSDCGIANVNIGTSGAEIGGAFGGEKETGGGRVAGSDAWKNYMRRQTVTINWGKNVPLAQGIEFDI